MPYFQRSFASVVVVFVLLVSLCVLQPAKVSARKRCPVEIPDSLLTLYLKSDLIVVASVDRERFLKTVEEYPHGSTFETEKNLHIFETLKGRVSDSATFREIDYKPKNPEENGESFDDARPSGSDKALFFLEKDEDGFYRLADSSSGIKELDAGDLNVYVKRIAELKRITTTKKNQFEKLTEWLVRLAEEPVTRSEGTIDLLRSFRALEYERASGEEQEEQTTNKKPVALNKDFRAENTSEIAKLLNDSQKQRLTNALLLSVNADLIKLNEAKSEEEVTPDYWFISLVGNWHKTSLAATAFAFLQNAGDSNRYKVTYLLGIITNLLEDDELYTLSSDYQSALAEDENAETELTDEETIEPEAISPESETPVEVENSTESKQVESAAEAITAENKAPEAEAETVEKPAAKITYKEYREKLYAKFVRQYGMAISQISSASK